MVLVKTRNAEAFCALRAGLFLGKGGIDLFVHLKRLRGAFRTRNSLFFGTSHTVLLERGILMLFVQITKCF